MAMIRRGRSDSEIARKTKIPRPTVVSWRHGRGSSYHERRASASALWRPTDARAYCYLLGIYLGDGCIVVLPSGAAKLIVSLDSSYPQIIETVEDSARRVLPDARVRRGLGPNGTVTVVRVSDPALPFAFPQHGRGRKHTRQIVLTEWQRELTHAHPEALLRAVADASPLAMWILDPTGHVVLWSPSAARLTGWSAEEALGEVAKTMDEKFKKE
jgi:PAS domain-containing protein